MSDKRLGRGIESLISPEPASKSSKPGVAKIFLKNIKPNPYQPRRYFDKHALDELVASIKVKGVLTPITVRETKIGYELIAGERRWRAAIKAKLKKIPAYVIDIKTDSEMMEVALIENIQREDLNPMEESEAYAVLNSKYNLSHDAIAKSVGKKRVTVSNSLRLLKLPLDIRKSISKGEISGGHGRAILQAKTINHMNKLWKLILKKALSVKLLPPSSNYWAAAEQRKLCGSDLSFGHDVHDSSGSDRSNNASFRSPFWIAFKFSNDNFLSSMPACS